jgi:hypothetical protein
MGRSRIALQAIENASVGFVDRGVVHDYFLKQRK